MACYLQYSVIFIISLQLCHAALSGVALSSSTETTITMSWGGAVSPHGISSNFTVVYTVDGSPKTFNTYTDLTIFDQQGSINIIGLTNGKNYTVSLLIDGNTMDLIGNIYTKPLSPSSFTVTAGSPSTTSVKLDWTVNANSNQETFSVKGGEILVTGLTGNTHSMTGLIPGKTYTLTFVAVTGSMESSPKASTPSSITTNPLPPTNLKVPTSKPTTTTRVFLEWTAGAGSIQGSYEVTATLSDGTAINPYPSITIAGNFANVTNLTPGARYKFVVQAVSNGKKSGNSNAFLETTYPLPPSNLKLSLSNATTTTSIYLEWTATVGSTQENYEVTVIRSDGTATSPLINVLGTTAVVTQLSPGVSYNFTVKAVSHDRRSENSNGITETTSPSVPATFTVGSSSVTQTSVTLTWTQGVGLVDEYSIAYSHGSAISTITPNPTGISHMVDGLAPDTNYTFTIKAISNGKESMPKQTSQKTSALSRITDLKATTATESEITVTWTKATGEYETYRITYTDKATGSSAKVTNAIPKDSESHTITGLVAGHSYAITIRLKLGNSMGPESNVLNNNTNPATPLGVTVSDVDTTTVNVTWNVLTGMKYVVEFEKSTGDGTNKQSAPSCNSSGCNIDVSNTLTPGEAVKVYVYAELGGRRSTPGTATGNTKPNAPGIPSINTRTENKLVVSSSRPSNTIIDGWLIVVEPSLGVITYSHDAPDGMSRIFAIENLSPGKRYTIFISTKSGMAESSSVKSTFLTKPYPPNSLSQSSVTTTELVVEWVVPSKTSVFDKYVISIADSGGNKPSGTTSPVEVNKETTPLKASFQALNPGVEYTVTAITAITVGNIRSTPITKKFRTKPNKVTNIRIDTRSSRTTNKLNVRWDAPVGGNIEKYIVELSEVSGSSQDRTSADASFSNLQAGTKYTVIVNAQSGPLNPTTSGQVSYVTYTLPGKVTINSVEPTTSTIAVSWSAPADNFNMYELQLCNSQCSNVGVQVNITDKTSTQYTFNSQSGVIPGTIYTFKIRSVTGEGSNIFKSDVTLRKTTTAPLPPATPIVSKKTTKTVTLTWVAPTATVHGYEVSYATSTSSSVTVDVAGGSVTRDFSGLVPGETYMFKIKSYVNDHTSKKLYSSEVPQSVTMIPNKPSNVAVPINKIQATTLTVTWDNPSDFFTGFEILWKQNSTIIGTVPVNKGTNQLLIDNLMRGNTYAIEVKSVSGSEKSAVVNTSATTKPNGTSINVDQVTTTSIKVSWPVPNSAFSNYELQITPNDGSLSLPIKINKNDPLIYTFSNLKPGVTYICTVIVDSSGSKTESPREITTNPLKVTSLTVTAESINSLRVSWSVDTSSKQSTFELKAEAITAGGNNNTKSVVHTSGSMKYDVIVEGLSPGYKYALSVTPVSNDVSGAAEQKEQYTKPGAVTSLKVSNHNTASVTLMWTAGVNSHQDRYEVTYSGNIKTELKTKGSISGTETTITALFPGDKYTFTVNAYSGLVKSADTIITKVLYPLIPAPTWSNLQNQKSATFTWLYDSNTYHAKKFYLKLTKTKETTVVKEYRTTDATTLKYTFTTLIPGQKYTVSIFAETFDENGNPVRSQSPGTADSTVRPEISSTITEDVTNTDETQVAIDYTEDNGVFDNYVFSINQQQMADVIKAKVDTRKVTFTKLTPSTLYTVSAKTRSGALQSAPKQVSIITKPAAPTLKCQVTTGNITLVITPPTSGNNIGDYVYEMSCIQSDQNLCFQGEKTSPQLSHRFTKLTPYHFYTLRTKVKYTNPSATANEIKFSKEAQIVCQTKESEPGPMDVFNVTSISPSDVELSWQPPKAPNGKLQAFWIEYHGSMGSQKTKKVVIYSSVNSSFTMSVADLFAGYKYTFSIWSENGAGNSTKFTQVIDLPIAAPLIRNVDQTDSRPKIGKFEHNKVELTLIDVFSRRYGSIQSFTLYAIPNQIPEDKSSLDSAGTWASQIEVIPQGPYIVISKCSNIYSNEAKCPIRTRVKREAFPAPLTEATITVGEDDKCDKKDINTYCNGPLQPDTTYFFLIRACADEAGTLCSDTPYSEAVTTGSAPLEILTIALAVVLSVIVLLLLGVGIFVVICLRRRGLICNPDTQPVYPKPKKDPLQISMKGIPTNRPVKIQEFPAHVDNMSKDCDFLFAEEYEELKPVGRDQPLDCSELPVNRPKNRFNNILPYDHSRVKLLPSEDEEGSDYINGNWMPGFNSKREFICTQGPLPSTTDDFWRMVWEQNCRAIVMLTKCVEKGREKCHHYWPIDTEPMFYGDLQVEIRNESKTQEYVVTEFQISKGNDVRRIKHFHYLAWPDMTPPETDEIIPFIRMFRVEIPPRNDNGAIIVHCSAGVGRSGAFIAVDRVLQQLYKSNNNSIDIFGLVREMRLYRVCMVQTEVFQNVIENGEGGFKAVYGNAGVGRSGTFIVLDRLLQQVEHNKDEPIDAYGILFEMRKYRVWMVQTEQQYICIHKCLKCVLEGKEYESVGMANPGYEVDYYCPDTSSRIANMFPNQLTPSDTESQLEDEGIQVNGR